MRIAPVDPLARTFQQDVAESLGIPNLPENVASALASDVEYRLNQVIEVRYIGYQSRFLSTEHIEFLDCITVYSPRSKKYYDNCRHR
jgi:hypothetical protein